MVVDFRAGLPSFVADTCLCRGGAHEDEDAQLLELFSSSRELTKGSVARVGLPTDCGDFESLSSVSAIRREDLVGRQKSPAPFRNRAILNEGGRFLRISER
jgi:hypothetical protein